MALMGTGDDYYYELAWCVGAAPVCAQGWVRLDVLLCGCTALLATAMCVRVRTYGVCKTPTHVCCAPTGVGLVQPGIEHWLPHRCACLKVCGCVFVWVWVCGRHFAGPEKEMIMWEGVAWVVELLVHSCCPEPAVSSAYCQGYSVCHLLAPLLLVPPGCLQHLHRQLLQLVDGAGVAGVARTHERYAAQGRQLRTGWHQSEPICRKCRGLLKRGLLTRLAACVWPSLSMLDV